MIYRLKLVCVFTRACGAYHQYSRSLAEEHDGGTEPHTTANAIIETIIIGWLNVRKFEE
jgi:hypothetical protein